VRAVILVLHVASGAVALALGPLALLQATRRRHGVARLGAVYHWTVLIVCATATVVSALAFARLWWLVPIAVLSYGLALAGYLGSRRHWPLWMRAHAWGGSYIALITALLVVSVPSGSPVLQTVAWILPAAIGIPLIVRVHTRWHASTASQNSGR